ncbi:MAG TPA: UPF0175 family protein [Thermoanaerobaculia bacterium]|nr:UPF0175 family protein [Thermoanaerobaculia bacterium]
MKIPLEVPDPPQTEEGPADAESGLKLSVALQLFRSGQLSAGAAAELAGLDRLAFAEECQREGIALVDYPAPELTGELRLLRRGGG